jgi:hypothetical protein
MRRCTSLIKYAVSAVLDGLVLSFSWDLMLLVTFTLPIVNAETAENICYFMAKNGLATVTDELKGGTTLDNVIFQCVDELLVCLNAIDISDLGVHTNKDHSSSRTIINGWDI